jgi:hypothetical protein
VAAVNAATADSANSNREHAVPLHRLDEPDDTLIEHSTGTDEHVLAAHCVAPGRRRLALCSHLNHALAPVLHGLAAPRDGRRATPPRYKPAGAPSFTCQNSRASFWFVCVGISVLKFSVNLKLHTLA